MKYKCPCCEYYTLNEKPPDTFDICPVCFWEDDGLQYEKPNYSGGANKNSLNIAKENYKKFGAVEKRLIKYCRKPKKKELSGIDW